MWVFIPNNILIFQNICEYNFLWFSEKFISATLKIGVDKPSKKLIMHA